MNLRRLVRPAIMLAALFIGAIGLSGFGHAKTASADAARVFPVSYWDIRFDNCNGDVAIFPEIQGKVVLIPTASGYRANFELHGDGYGYFRGGKYILNMNERQVALPASLTYSNRSRLITPNGQQNALVQYTFTITWSGVTGSFTARCVG